MDYNKRKGILSFIEKIALNAATLGSAASKRIGQANVAAGLRLHGHELTRGVGSSPFKEEVFNMARLGHRGQASEALPQALKNTHIEGKGIEAVRTLRKDMPTGDISSGTHGMDIIKGQIDHMSKIKPGLNPRQQSRLDAIRGAKRRDAEKLKAQADVEDFRSFLGLY